MCRPSDSSSGHQWAGLPHPAKDQGLGRELALILSTSNRSRWPPRTVKSPLTHPIRLHGMTMICYHNTMTITTGDKILHAFIFSYEEQMDPKESHDHSILLNFNSCI